MKPKGLVAIIGAGPGDPELITVKGLKYLLEADVILYDRLAPRELLELVKPGAKIVYVGKEPGRHTLSQEEINRILVEEALKGKIVVRLKGGDPYTFGRGEEECIYVRKHGVPCIVVPGVPSYVAAAVEACAPLATRLGSSSFAVITGREAEGKPRNISVEKVAAAVDTLVILMGVSRAVELLGRIARVRGWDTPALVVMNATRPDEKIVGGTIADIVEEARKGTIRNPAVIIVGEAARLREKLCANAESSS